MATTTDLSWFQVLSRGHSKKVINAQPQRAKDDKFKLVPEGLYEHDDLKAEVLTRKAAVILQQALTPGSVLFAFPNKTFDHPSRQGITYQNIVFKATAAKDNSEGRLTHAQMTIVRMTDMETFVEDLQKSLKFYGKVYQIKKYTIDGFFEGHISFLIDTTVNYRNAEGKEYDIQPLSRMMYLSAWDVYVPATYRGAPPVCHFCRQSGHIRDACPVLAKRQCFKCRKLGHTARFCREEETTFEDALEEYESSKKANEENNTVETQRRPNDGERKKRRGATHTIHDHVAQQLQRQITASQSTASHGSQISNAESSAMEVDPKTLQRTPHGSDASKHAPLASSLYMHVDSQASVASVSSLNGFQSDVLPLRRHSMSSTSMSQTPVYHAAHRA
ncbi:uncharacterized protein ATC70_006188 [Mucor velutinosus]|uniref:CCHC-type domain-containing protein n=1 Tax=Mucor velutinosus TaxID=708070 RepID=A0AAN7HK07_9FUNG|nr:hypothetical protein ATC70_006188 [Mucor velutinosus]